MTKTMKICVINGPNLNMLGMREPGIYGDATLSDIEKRCRELASGHKIGMDWFQSNSESALIGQIQRCVGNADWIVINAGGYTHTSVALRDALSLFPGGVIEVHISNIHTREAFRHTSLISGIAKGVIAGFGPASYYMAIEAIPNLTLEA
jgi:3-dehydroquinate dehydratase-2